MGHLCVSCGYNPESWSSNYPYASLVLSLITVSSEESPLKTFLSELGSQLLQVGGPGCLCWDTGKGKGSSVMALAITYHDDNPR